ncbi:response regulator [Nodosilinea sp. LEGE 07298]|uniref:response regulator n=1 Tax=Nodosilinea sp. LEGE 07298 TaxID=2777970 RepID=UPI001882974F|nr:response regulator [Nodosilinea sp. LEGE 07298]MBE9112139.1 response regulator [Nodosilinea sp. LEGE 07298]
MFDVLNDGEASLAQPQAASSALISFNRLLYIDNNPDIRLVVQVSLEAFSSIRVITTPPENALRLASSYAWDVILMEVSIHQDIDLAVYNQLRSHPKTRSLPIIILTSRVMPHELAVLKELDILGIIAKPFDSTQLGDQIRSFL